MYYNTMGLWRIILGFLWQLWVFVYNYKHLYSIKRNRRGFLCIVITIGWCIYRCYCLYFASIVHGVMILCILGVDLGIFVCYHVVS
nr:MAG TPA: hypothetical protein [Caudoviricetes sp.]